MWEGEEGERYVSESAEREARNDANCSSSTLPFSSIPFSSSGGRGDTR